MVPGCERLTISTSTARTINPTATSEVASSEGGEIDGEVDGPNRGVAESRVEPASGPWVGLVWGGLVVVPCTGKASTGDRMCV